MKLTTFTDYSLRVLMYLAAVPGRRATIAAIAASFDISENHLVKVVHFLGKAGWLTNLRGKGGGLTLALPAEDISLGQVIRDTEGVIAPAECFGTAGSACCIQRICRLKGVLARAVNAFYGALDPVTLADVVENRNALAKVLFVDATPGPKRRSATR